MVVPGKRKLVRRTCHSETFASRNRVRRRSVRGDPENRGCQLPHRDAAKPSTKASTPTNDRYQDSTLAWRFAERVAAAQNSSLESAKCSEKEAVSTVL